MTLFSFLSKKVQPNQPISAGYLPLLKPFVAATVVGGNVDEIDISHPIYVQMRAFTPVVNGKKLTIEEKFELAGHPRKSKINDMELFYNRLCELESFKDENGYVDSYRKDDTMKGFLSYLSIRYDLPMSLVICLLGDQKLQKHVVVTDRIQYLKKLLTDYLTEHKNFIGIRRLDPKLYNFLTATSKAFPTPSGRKLRNLDLIELLGFEDVDNGFAKDTNFVNFSEELFMTTYMPIIRENGGVISLADIDHTDNYRLNLYLRRKNETKAEFFARYNVKFNQKYSVALIKISVALFLLIHSAKLCLFQPIAIFSAILCNARAPPINLIFHISN
jgi:hypothetical protein